MDRNLEFSLRILDDRQTKCKLGKNYSTVAYELKEPRNKLMDADQQPPELTSAVAKADSGTFPPYRS